MKNLKIIVGLAAVVLMSACQMKQKVMDAGIVSMTYPNIPEGMKLAEAGSVSGEFCPQAMSDSGPIGLFDQAVKSAQDKNGIDFITNASFWRDGSGCILLEGTGQKLRPISASR
jgi:hypothetical protein